MATSFSARNNAKRAAERMITVGIAPSIDYGLRENDDGRFEIVWKTAAEDSVEDCVENDAERTEVMEADEEFNEEPEDEPQDFGALPNPWPTGSRVKIRRAPRSVTGTVVERVSATHWSVHLDFTQPGEVELFDDEEMVSEVAAAAPRRITPPPRSDDDTKAPRARKREIASRVAAGEMPVKPIITSKTNAGYQKRFDKVEALATAGDWDGVRDYAINGVNSYAKMLREYRERLLSAHAASTGSQAA